jgi:predicted acylesterase/phospholipase RssA
MLKWSYWVANILAIAMVAGCASAIKRNPVPESLVDVAEVRNLDGIRFWGDAAPPDLQAWFKESRWDQMGSQSHHYLAISGGGENGAYGAGFLNGWTAAGTRPEFTIVTGISTGALLAPFAFLGSDYDDDIKALYTELSKDDLVERRSIFEMLPNASIIDNSSLRGKVVQYVTQEVMEKIAAEYQKGRILIVGTTNLDTNRPVLWSIGRIATSGTPDALELIHDIIIASTSIGGAFPPVIISVEANGESYDEMHVDGGTVNQVFMYPLGMDFNEVKKRVGLTENPKVYVLRNARLKPVFQVVEYSMFEVMVQSLNSLLRTQGIGDIERIYLEARRDGLDFHLTYIPDDFNAPLNGLFDSDYMNKLYQVGYERALQGGDWQNVPPGFNADNVR